MKRRGFALMLSVVLAMTMIPTVSAKTMNIDNRRIISMTSVFTAFKHASGVKNMSMEDVIEADINFDTIVDMTDVMVLYQAASGGGSLIPNDVALGIRSTTQPTDASVYPNVEVGTSMSGMPTTVSITHNWGKGIILEKACVDAEKVYLKMLVNAQPEPGYVTTMDVRLDMLLVMFQDIELLYYFDNRVPTKTVSFETVFAEETSQTGDGEQHHDAMLIRSAEELTAAVPETDDTYDETFFEDYALILVEANESLLPATLDVSGVKVNGNKLIVETKVSYNTDASYDAVVTPSIYHKTMLLKVPASEVAPIENAEVTRYCYREIDYTLL